MSKVVRFHQAGPPSVLVLEDEDVGLPGNGQVRLRQDAIGVNFVDTALRDGSFRTALPAVGGVQSSGIVDAIGPGVTGFAVGDRVAYFFAPGAYAEIRNVDADVLVHLPDAISNDIAAAVLTKGLTAWMAVRKLYPVKAGETVLVQGATGGVGNLVARWAHLLGATVIGTGSAAKLADLDAAQIRAIASDDPDLADKVRAIAPDGVDVVFEFVGRATFAASAVAVRDGGAIVTIGAASGAPAIDKEALAARGVTVSGGSTAQMISGNLLQIASAELFEHVAAGNLGSFPIKAYPLGEAARAHGDIASRDRGGYQILTTGR
jgi:NADPH2:quinone reductase